MSHKDILSIYKGMEVVNKNVKSYALMIDVPARRISWIGQSENISI